MTYLAILPTPMPRIRSAKPKFEPTKASLALKLRRTELGKSQADVAFDSEVLTQTTISELERGKYGPEDLTSARLAALARGLNWSLPELEKALDIDLGLSAYADDVSSVPFDPRTLFHPPAPYEDDDEIYMPEALQEAIDRFGDEPEYAGLKDPDIQRQLALLRRLKGAPTSAGEWLTLYSMNRRWLEGKD